MENLLKCPVCSYIFNYPYGGCPHRCPNCRWPGGCDGFEEVDMKRGAELIEEHKESLNKLEDR